MLMTPSLLPFWPWLLFLALMALAPAWTKFGGAAWLLLVLMALMARWKHHSQPTPSSSQSHYAKQWLAWCLIAFGIRSIAQIYWNDSWSARHFDIRLLVGALATWWLIQHQPKPPIGINLIIGTLIAGAISGLAIVILHIEFGYPTPSNRINWAVGLSFMCCLLLGLVFDTKITSQQEKIIWTGVSLYLLAIFFSGVRGAYFIFPWSLFIFAFFLLRNYKKKSKPLQIKIYSIALIIIIILSLLPSISSHPESPVQRILKGVNEVQLMIGGNSMQIAGETSMGIRISMWNHGIELIKKQPWIGYGLENRIIEIQNLGKALGSASVQKMTHFHSEYINNWVEHGLPGLASTLAYIMGLFFISYKSFKNNKGFSIAIMGITLLHLTASLTNLNSRHNNYGVMMTICIALSIYFYFKDEKINRADAT